MKYALITLSFLLPSLTLAQSVDLLWQGEGYTPPFYLGGVPWVEQGSITMLAVPQGLGNSNNLNYKWIVNGTVVGLRSGVGKNTFSFNDPVFSKPQAITVQIVDGNDNVRAENSTTVRPTAPKVLIYERNSLYGLMFHREVGSSYRLEGEEVSFEAVPFFFSATSKDYGSLQYTWKSNAGEDGFENFITYRVPEGPEGAASVSASVVNNNTLKQRAEKRFLVQFGHEE